MPESLLWDTDGAKLAHDLSVDTVLSSTIVIFMGSGQTRHFRMLLCALDNFLGHFNFIFSNNFQMT